MLVKGVKRNSTRKSDNNPGTRRKFLIMRVKQRKYFIEPIVHVNNRAFDQFSLMRSK